MGGRTLRGISGLSHFVPRCNVLLPSPQILEESSKLQNMRLERQQALQKKHLRELKEFAEAYSNDKLLPSSQRERQNSEQGSLSSEQSHTSSQTSIGKVSL